MALFVAVVAVAFTSLGRWQLDRLEQRRHANAHVAEQQQLPPVPAGQALGQEVTDADQWRRVELSGTFDAEHQLAVRQRRNGEAAGYEVLTPLRTPDGAAVLVSRGFVTLEQGQPVPDTLPAPPGGAVTVQGWLRRNEQGRDPLITPIRSSVRLVNAPAVAATLPYPVTTTGWVAAYAVEPAQPGALEPIQVPAPTEGNHFSYALQWFAFTGIAVVGVVVLVRGDLRERRQAAGAGSGGPGPGPDPG
nr:SURF1 family protein [Auraticoccus cholistanensis]